MLPMTQKEKTQEIGVYFLFIFFLILIFFHLFLYIFKEKKRKENLSDAGEREEERSSERLQYFIFLPGGHHHDRHQNNKHHSKQTHLRKLLYNNSLVLERHLFLNPYFEIGMSDLTEKDTRIEPYPRYTAN